MGYNNLLREEEIKSAKLIPDSATYPQPTQEDYEHTVPPDRAELISEYRDAFEQFNKYLNQLLDSGLSEQIASHIDNHLLNCTNCIFYKSLDTGKFACERAEASEIPDGATTGYATDCDEFSAKWMDSNDLPGSDVLPDGYVDYLRDAGQDSPRQMERIRNYLRARPSDKNRRRLALQLAFYEHLANPIGEEFDRTRVEAFLRDIGSERARTPVNRGIEFEERVFGMLHESGLPLLPRRISYEATSGEEGWREMDVHTELGGEPLIIELFTRGGSSTKGRFLKKYAQGKTYQRVYRVAKGRDPQILLLNEDFSRPQISSDLLFKLLDETANWGHLIPPKSVTSNEHRTPEVAELRSKDDSDVNQFIWERINTIAQADETAESIHSSNPEDATRFLDTAESYLEDMNNRADSWSGLVDVFSAQPPEPSERTCNDCRHQRSNSGGEEFLCRKITDGYEDVKVKRADDRASDCSEFDPIYEDWIELPHKVRLRRSGREQRQISKTISGRHRPIPDIQRTAIQLAFESVYGDTEYEWSLSIALHLAQHAGGDPQCYPTERDCRQIGASIRKQLEERGYPLLPRFVYAETGIRSPPELLPYVDFHTKFEGGHIIGKVIDSFRKRLPEEDHLGWNWVRESFEVALGEPVYAVTLTTDGDQHGVCLDESLFSALMYE